MGELESTFYFIVLCCIVLYSSLLVLLLTLGLAAPPLLQLARLGRSSWFLSISLGRPAGGRFPCTPGGVGVLGAALSIPVAER